METPVSEVTQPAVEKPTSTVIELVEANTESTRQLATIQKITSLSPIENADKIEVATILGWHCVVQKGLHKVGDLVVYVEIDSVLPELPEFEWMRPYGFRVKTIRLRKQISEGIVLPLDDLNIFERPATFSEGSLVFNGQTICREGWGDHYFPREFYDHAIGIDVTQAIGITKYVRPDKGHGPANIRKGRPDNWPAWCPPKTDETRIQSIYKYVENYIGKEFYFSEKIDGESMTCYLHDNEFGVCSRNYDLEPDPNNNFWKLAIQEKIEEKLRKAYETNFHTEYAVQGERCGVGVQGNKLKLTNVQFRVFNVFNITAGKFLDYKAFLSFCDEFGFDTVPIGMTPFILQHTCDEIVEMAVKKSALNKEVWVEGLVFRPVEEIHDSKLGRVSFKAINPEFKLKYGE